MWMYGTEIRMMMHSFGDKRSARVSTSRYIECLVRNLVRRLILKSRNIQRLRKRTALEIEDICFVLRKDMEIVSRIIQSSSMKMHRLSMNMEDGARLPSRMRARRQCVLTGLT